MEENEIKALVKLNVTEKALQELASNATHYKEANADEKAYRIKLRDARVSLAKFAKSKRDGYTQATKLISTEEKRLLAIIAPEEERLQALEEEAKLEEERRGRVALLPVRKAELAEIKGVDVTDEFLLTLDSDGYIEFVSNCKAVALEKERLALDADRANLEREKDKIARDKELEETAEKAKLEERERAEQAEKDRIESEKKAEEDRVEKEAEDARKLAEDEGYKEFLRLCGYKENDENYTIIEKEGVVHIYKLIGTFQKNK